MMEIFKIYSATRLSGSFSDLKESFCYDYHGYLVVENGIASYLFPGFKFWVREKFRIIDVSCNWRLTADPALGPVYYTVTTAEGVRFQVYADTVPIEKEELLQALA